MATTNVACPFCGRETRVTVPENDSGKPKKLKKVVQNHLYTEWFKTTIHAGCLCCGESFGVLFE
jgi:uncharacterized Zn finger protein (UPF0148 family)